MKIRSLACTCILILLFVGSASSQVELVEAFNPVYRFLKEVQVSGFIGEYNSSSIPLSRREIAQYLTELELNKKRLPENYRERLSYFTAEFEYDMYGKTNMQNNLLEGNVKLLRNRDTHLYYYTDSSVALFTDIGASGYYRHNDFISSDEKSVAYGLLGISARGTLFDQVGVNLAVADNYYLTGIESAIPFNYPNVPGADGFRDFRFENQDEFYYSMSGGDRLDVYQPFTGYVRYATANEWFSAFFGRMMTMQGYGYIDKLFLSGNCVPYDVASIGLKYKAVEYRFSYGSISGDSSGFVNQSVPESIRELSSKNLVSHYLNINFSEAFRLGLWESVVVSEQPFSFTYLNPVSFLTSADLSAGDESTSENNSLIGIETEIVPARGISFQAGLLIDDLTFGTLFEDDSLNENKFGWQLGAMYTGVPGLAISAEYTHLDPFVYSHRSNKSTFTNRGFTLGHALPPNSDEIALQIDYDPLPYLSATLTCRFQRSGYSVDIDETGNLRANYGGYITFGLGDAYLRTNNFLDGVRVNRSYITLNASAGLTREIFVDARVEYRNEDSVISSGNDLLLDVGMRVRF